MLKLELKNDTIIKEWRLFFLRNTLKEALNYTISIFFNRKDAFMFLQTPVLRV